MQNNKAIKAEENFIARKIRKNADKIKRECKLKIQAKKNFEHFLEQERMRVEKRNKKREKYCTAHKAKSRRFITRKEQTELKTYLVNIQSYALGNKGIIEGKPFTITCKSEELSGRLQKYHKKYAKSMNDKYIGIFAYPVNLPKHCIYELVTSKHISINGKLTSKIATQRSLQLN